MKVSCQRCNPKEAFEIPPFSSEEKKKLQKLYTISSLVLIKEIRDAYGISLREVKFITTHINTKHQECHRCKKQIHAHEYTRCTSCGALNVNWNEND